MFYRDLADVAGQLNGQDLDLDGVLRIFCMRKFADQRFFATFFLEIEQDGRLRTKAFFGAKPEEIGIPETGISVFDEHPAAESIRRDEMVCAVVPTVQGSILAWPVERNAQILGSLVAISDTGCDESDEIRECLDALALLVSSTVARKVETSQHPVVGRERRTKVENHTLTERQQVILKLIAEGRTNGDIAEILGYSESLIRQETIRIYAVLRCNGRQEATDIYLSRLAPSLSPSE